jgi:hypothetical protein
MASQAVAASSPFETHARGAPEPRDIVWQNMAIATGQVRLRELFVLGCITLIFLFWIFPINALAVLLSYKEIKKALPWLGRLIDKDDRVRALVQNSLPSVAMISLNALIPFLLEGQPCLPMKQGIHNDVSLIALTYVQGFRARSLVEYSLLKK